MKLNLLLVLSCLLAMMLPIGNHRTYIPSLSEATIPNMDAHSASTSVYSPIAPTPVPTTAALPRFSPLVVPVHSAGAVRKPRWFRYDLSKQVLGIYKRIAALIVHTKPPASQPRPSRTTHLPTKVIVPIYTAPPTPAYHNLDDAPAYDPLSSSIKLAVLWDTYKLVLVWVTMVCASVIYAFACLFSRDYSSVYMESVSVEEAPLLVFESIIEMYCALGFPPVAGSETPSDADNSIPEDDLLPATEHSSGPTAVPNSISVDAGIMSVSDVASALEGRKTLEPAVSSDSIGSGIGHYADDSFSIVPSSSTSSIARSPEGLLAQFPPSGQVHSPQHQTWLQDLITRLQEMQRQGNYYGRVYDGHPELEETIPATPTSSGCIASAEHTPSPPPRGISRRGVSSLAGIPDSTSLESGLSSIAERVPSKSPVAAGLSTTVSQDLLYGQLASLVDSASELGDDSDAESEGGQVVTESGDKPHMSPADDPTDTPLPPSSYAESASTIFGGIVSEIDELLSTWGR